MMSRLLASSWLVLMVFVIPLSSQATIDKYRAGELQVGRYSNLLPLPSTQQEDILQAIIHVRFHQKITTVGEALEYLLMRSGYRLPGNLAGGSEMAILLSHPLPEVHRELGPMPLEKALLTLAGPVYRLVIDPLNRLLSFEVIDRYRDLIPKASPFAMTKTPVFDDLTQVLDSVEQVTDEQLDDKLAAAVVSQAPAEVKDEHDYYGPTKASDTLFGIARQYADALGVSTHRIVYALFELNREAFGKVAGKRNMNSLNKDMMLKIPSVSQLSAIEEQVAISAIHNHTLQWQQNYQG